MALLQTSSAPCRASPQPVRAQPNVPTLTRRALHQSDALRRLPPAHQRRPAPPAVAAMHRLAATAARLPPQRRAVTCAVASLPRSSGPWRWLQSELASRLCVTMLLILLARVGHFVPLPGVSLHAAGGRTAMEMLMGSSEVAANAFVLGIAPLMSAYFFLGVASILPPLRKYFAELREMGPRGRDAYTAYLTVLFICFAGWEAVSLARSWLPAHAPSLAAAAVEQAAGAASEAAASAAAAGAASGGGLAGWFARTAFVVWSAAAMTAGAAILKHVTQMVDQHGLGSGVGLLIALGVAASYAHYLREAAMLLAAAPPAPLAALAVVTLCAGLVAASLWAQATLLQLPITFYRARSSASSQQHPLQQLLASPPKHHQQRQRHTEQQPEQQQQWEQGQGTSKRLSFPLQLSPSGARSLLFANFWVALLQPFFSWLGLPNPFTSALGFAALVLAVEGISFADMTPRQISQYLSGCDAGIKGLSPGEATIDFLASKRRQLKLLNAALLAALSLASRGVDAASAALIGVPVGCLNLLLLASTVASAIRQVEALSRAPLIEQLVAREEAAAGWQGGLKFPMPESRWN